MNNPKVTILLLNYNGWKDAIECLESVYRITYSNWEVILVDNGSEDGSVSKIKEWAAGKIPVESKFFEYDAERKPIKYIEELLYDEEETRVNATNKEKRWDTLPPHQKLSILRIEKNRGFTGGNNIGIEYILEERKANYILLLSNDVLLEPNWLEKMACFLNSDPQLGACGCKMIDFYNPSVIDVIGLRIDKFGFPHLIGHSEKDEGQYDLFKDELFISGCCFLIKREVLEKLDEAFDPDYFALGEDLDLSWRIKLLGYRLKINTATKAYHKSGSTLKPLGKKLNTRYLSERNTIRSLLKNYSTSSLLKVMIPYFILWSAEVLFFFFTLRPKMATGVIKAMGWNLLHLKETLAKRKRIQQTRVIGDDSLRDFFVSGSEKIRILKGWRAS